MASVSVDIPGRVGLTTTVVGLLSRPFLWCMAFFWATMVGLSIAHPLVHDLALAIRWPVLAAMAVIGFGIWVVRAKGRLSFAFILLAVFLAIALASSIHAYDPWYSVQRGGSLVLLACVAVGVGAYGRRQGDAAATIDLLFWLGTLLVIGGLIFRGGDSGDRYGGLHDRATGAGTYAALMLPIAIHQASRRLRGIGAAFAWFVAFAMVAQMALAGARAALAVGVVMGLLLVLRFHGLRGAAWLAAVGMILPLALLVPGVWERASEKWERIVRTESLGTFTGRLDRWVFGLEQFQRKPLFGHGLGASRFLAGEEAADRFRLRPGETFTLHSDQIEVMVDTGLTGWIFFALFWLVLLAGGVRAFRDAVTRPMAAALFGSVAYAFVDTFMHGGFLAAGGGVAGYTWPLLSLFAAVRTSSLEDRQPIARRLALIQESTRTLAAVHSQEHNLRQLRVRRLRRDRLPTARRLTSSS